jgi:hypothetical protein
MIRGDSFDRLSDCHVLKNVFVEFVTKQASFAFMHRPRNLPGSSVGYPYMIFGIFPGHPSFVEGNFCKRVIATDLTYPV